MMPLWISTALSAVFSTGVIAIAAGADKTSAASMVEDVPFHRGGNGGGSRAVDLASAMLDSEGPRSGEHVALAAPPAALIRRDSSVSRTSASKTAIGVSHMDTVGVDASAGSLANGQLDPVGVQPAPTATGAKAGAYSKNQAQTKITTHVNINADGVTADDVAESLGIDLPELADTWWEMSDEEKRLEENDDHANQATARWSTESDKGDAKKDEQQLLAALDDASLNTVANVFKGDSRPDSLVPTCAQERALRGILAKAFAGGRGGPAVIRYVFHDAIDENNLLLRKKWSEDWELVTGEYGGVDGCLFSPLTQVTRGHSAQSHDRDLPHIFPFAQKICDSICAHTQAGVCDPQRDSCVLEVTVLASVVAIEEAGGPPIDDFFWGRSKRPCSAILIQSLRNQKQVVENYHIEAPAVRFAPVNSGLETPAIFRAAFERIGFSAKDQVALMGAHSFGKLGVAAGGLKGVGQGGFCPQRDLLDPPLGEENMVPWSHWPDTGGNCKPKVEAGGPASPDKESGRGCWYENNEKQSGDTLVHYLAPVYAYKNNSNFRSGFGDGGFWDATPEKFDNNYFQMFYENKFTDKDVCCGRISDGECRQVGGMVKVTERKKNGAPFHGRKALPCQVDWCRSDRKGKSYMKSTRAWHEASSAPPRRLVRLAGDWALLGNHETKPFVQQFAENQNAFFEAFLHAWTKVTKKGYGQIENYRTSLRTCVHEENEATKGTEDLYRPVVPVTAPPHKSLPKASLEKQVLAKTKETIEVQKTTVAPKESGSPTFVKPSTLGWISVAVIALIVA